MFVAMIPKPTGKRVSAGCHIVEQTLTKGDIKQTKTTQKFAKNTKLMRARARDTRMHNIAIANTFNMSDYGNHTQTHRSEKKHSVVGIRLTIQLSKVKTSNCKE